MAYENEMEALVNMMGPDYLSMFDGNGNNNNALTYYKGVENPFDKKTRLGRIAAMSQGREFDLTVVNANAGATKNFYLTPGLLIAEGDNGHPLSGKATDGSDLTFSSSSGPTTAEALKAFYRYIEKNPSVILGIRIETSDKTEMSKTIIVTTNINFSYAAYAKKKLNIQSYVDEHNEQRDIATIDVLLPADDQSQILVPVVPGTHTFTLFMGPAANLTQMLRNQALQSEK